MHTTRQVSAPLIDTQCLPSTLRLRKDRLASFRRLAGIDTDLELANRISVDPSTVSRVLNGTQAPGPRFIAGMVKAFGAELFPDLFEIIDAPQEVK